MDRSSCGIRFLKTIVPTTWVESFAAHGITFNPEDAYINEGRTGRGTINLVFNRVYGRDATEEEVEKIYGYKTELMRQRPAAPKMAKMQELIAHLRGEGVKVMVVVPWRPSPSERGSMAQDVKRAANMAESMISLFFIVGSLEV